VKLEPNEDQLELHRVARDVLADLAPLTLARSYLEGEGDGGPLGASLAELGWYSVGLEDDGFGVQGLCMLAERCGAHAAPSALVDTAVAARVAALLPAADELGVRIAAGEVPTALAVVEDGSDWTLEGMVASLSPTAEGFVLDGTKAGVQHGQAVGAFLVVAEHEGAPALAFVAAATNGCEASPAAALDAAAGTCILDLAAAPVASELVLSGAPAARALERGFRVGAVASAAEAVGAATAALEMAISYSREREQFGQPIGGFQALKHLMADAHVDRESAWSSVLYAAATLDEDDPGAAEAVAVAKAYSARATRAVVEAALQVLGGIAFTWEHDAHLLQRRVLAAERRFGDALQHERALGERLAARRAEALA
jgi:alkylation response protein AidB-like acyl-CoA dehydrogenase